jgi:serralysin
VRDFANGFDKIDLSAVDANINAEGFQGFTFLGVDKPFTGHAGELTFSHGVVKADLDGNGSGLEFEIQLDGVTTMSRSDFIL